jgi:DNA-directed RNA polymerase specialized sigma24 family protein
LWPLLLTITAQKSIDRMRWENRQRRGGGKVLRESDLSERDTGSSIDNLLSRDPTPEFLAEMDEQYMRLLSQLRDDTLRNIAQWKMEGHSNGRIAELSGISVHAVGRKLRLIRLAWSQELNVA